MISYEAVKSGARVLIEDGQFGIPWEDASEDDRAEVMTRARAMLEAAAPHMLSHEREQTRLAHLDAIVNRDTVARLEQAIAGVLELAAPMRHMVSADEIREWIAYALEQTA